MKKSFAFFCVLGISAPIFAKPLTVIAHRGASGYLPEHTLEGAAMAHSWDVDFIEPDVVLTKDNVPVILHDTHIDTTTNVAERFPKRAREDGRFYAIDFTLNEIKSLKVTERRNLKTGKAVYPKRFPLAKADFVVPTLVEFIELVQGLNQSWGRTIGIYPEIKAPAFHRQEGKDISKIVIKILLDYGYDTKPEQVFLQCFDANELKRIRKEFNPSFPLVQLIGENSWGESTTDYDKLKTKEGIKEIATYAQGIGPWIPQVLALDDKGKVTATNLTRWAHENGLKVHPYTLRADQLMKGVTFSDLVKHLSEGVRVDGIFTDFGDQLIDWRRQRNG